MAKASEERTSRKRSLRLASAVPFGVGETKPHHYLEMAEIAWRNRGKWGYAWRVLNDGVCDGCALGTSGLETLSEKAVEERVGDIRRLFRIDD